MRLTRNQKQIIQELGGAEFLRNILDQLWNQQKEDPKTKINFNSYAIELCVQIRMTVDVIVQRLTYINDEQELVDRGEKVIEYLKNLISNLSSNPNPHNPNNTIDSLVELSKLVLNTEIIQPKYLKIRLTKLNNKQKKEVNKIFDKCDRLIEDYCSIEIKK